MLLNLERIAKNTFVVLIPDLFSSLKDPELEPQMLFQESDSKTVFLVYCSHFPHGIVSSTNVWLHINTEMIGARLDILRQTTISTNIFYYILQKFTIRITSLANENEQNLKNLPVKRISHKVISEVRNSWSSFVKSH